MKAVTCQRMHDIEQHAFDQGVVAAHLMEQAGCGIAEEILKRYPDARAAIAYIGSGNNGGDALVALRELMHWGIEGFVRMAHQAEELNPLPQQHLSTVIEQGAIVLSDTDALPAPSQLLCLDGLLGIGAKGAIRSPLDRLAEEMNALNQRGATTIAMDTPSGLDADTGEVLASTVKAQLTCSVALPKVGILAESAINHVGAISHTPLPDLQTDTAENGLHLITSHTFPKQPRDFDFHKGQAGRVGIIAGSMGMLGAAVLTATGALRAGAGLVTIYCPERIVEALSIKAPAEVMVSGVGPGTSLDHFSALDALAIGPGLGSSPDSSAAVLENLLRKLIAEFDRPLVIDADGLNFVAREGLLPKLTANTIITPHPGEMERLVPGSKSRSRLETVQLFSKHSAATLLLKGARTLISAQDSPNIYINSTGTPGMATAGQGDLLTGVISGLLAQGYPNTTSTCMATWICGRASEIATVHQAPEALITTDTATYLGQAMMEWAV